VHAVATDQVQVRIARLQFLPNPGDIPRVVVVVNWIRFFLANDAAIYKVLFFRETNLNQLTSGKFN